MTRLDSIEKIIKEFLKWKIKAVHIALKELTLKQML